MANTIEVFEIFDAEPDDRISFSIVDRYGIEFEFEMSVEEALALAHDLVCAVGEEVVDDET